METLQHVENVCSHALTCGECGNISFENLLRRYSIRASSKLVKRSHPYLRPIENVCSEATSVHHDKRNKVLSDIRPEKVSGLICQKGIQKCDTAAGYFSNQISPESSLLNVKNQHIFPNLKLRAGSKSPSLHFQLEKEKKPSHIPDELHYAGHPHPYSSWKNSSSLSSFSTFQSEKALSLDSDSSSSCTIDLKSMVDLPNEREELCHNSSCNVCQDYNKVQFHLESLIATGTCSGEALNLLQQHCCSYENDELEFECELCGCSFDCSVELISHLSLHPENWPYVCQLCKKRFKTSLDEQRHLCGEVDKIVKSFVKF